MMLWAEKALLLGKWAGFWAGSYIFALILLLDGPAVAANLFKASLSASAQALSGFAEIAMLMAASPG